MAYSKGKATILQITVLLRNQILFQELSRKRPLLKSVLSERDQFLGQKFDIFFPFLLPVIRPPNMIKYDR